MCWWGNHLFVIFVVLDVLLAVKLCINCSFLKFIIVRTVVQIVLTATFNSYGDRQISTPHKINTPEPIDKKNLQNYYIRKGTSYTKFNRNPFTGGFWANGWNITKNIFFIYLYLFFFDQSIGQTRGWIFTRDSSKDVKSRKDVPFGGYKTYFKPLFIPKTVKFWPKRDSFSRPKMLNNRGTQE